MKFYLISLFSITLAFNLYSQEIKKDESLLLGLNYGQASQNRFPSNNHDYSYSNQYFKIQINYLLLKKNKLTYELNLEPGLYLSEHQLLNRFFIKPDDAPDYLEKRERFTKKRTFNEYALNIGIIVRYKILNDFSYYLLASIGPMFAELDTERLRKGFAFSEILGLGFAFKQKKIVFDLRLTLRHNSNANFSKPNNGHNSIGIESGISFQLK